MTPFGVIGDVYLVCCAVGTIYLLVGAFLGHMADSGSGHGVHIDASHGIGHGAHTAHGAHASSGHAHGDLADMNPSPSKVAVIPSILRGRFRPAQFILTLLSPMTISVFLAFFGIAGIFALKIAPWLGILSLIPAAIFSLLITGQVLRALGWMVRQMEVTSQADAADLIGQRAEVTVPIESGELGEVVFVIGLSRYNKSARAVNPEARFEQGSRVIISDIEGHVLLVEPWKEFLLEDSSSPQISNSTTVDENKLKE